MEGKMGREKISYTKYLFADYPIKLDDNIISDYAESLREHFNKKIFQTKFEKSFSSLLRENNLNEIPSGYKELIAQIIINRISDKLLHSFGAYLNRNYKDPSINKINKAAIDYCKILFSERKQGDEISIPIEHYIENALFSFSWLFAITEQHYVKVGKRLKGREITMKKWEDSQKKIPAWKIRAYKEIIKLSLADHSRKEKDCVNQIYEKYYDKYFLKIDKSSLENFYNSFRAWYKQIANQIKYLEIIEYLRSKNMKELILIFKPFAQDKL